MRFKFIVMRAPFDYANCFAKNKLAILLVILFCWFFQFVEENRKSVILGGGYGAQNFLAPIQSRDSRVFFKGILSKNQIEEV